MKISQIRKLLENYAEITAASGGQKKATAIADFSNLLAPVDNKTIAFVLKKLSKAK